MFNAICTKTLYRDEMPIIKQSELCTGNILSPFTILINIEGPECMEDLQIDSKRFLNNFIPVPFDPLEDKVYSITGLKTLSKKTQELIHKLLKLKKNGK